MGASSNLKKNQNNSQFVYYFSCEVVVLKIAFHHIQFFRDYSNNLWVENSRIWHVQNQVKKDMCAFFAISLAQPLVEALLKLTLQPLTASHWITPSKIQNTSWHLRDQSRFITHFANKG